MSSTEQKKSTGKTKQETGRSPANTAIRGNVPYKNLENLIHSRTIENDRVEFKAAWNEDTKQAVVRSVCAFANDLLNNNGGYIILGIEENHGKPALPPRGLDDKNIDRIQREVTGACKGSISPEYLPRIYIEHYRGKTIMILWTPAGENRPYEAPRRKGESKVYWIRSSGTTVEAIGDLRRQLMEQTAKIPYDDRRSLTGEMEDISLRLVNKFLRDIGSGLSGMELSLEEAAEQLNVLVPVNDHKVPRNVALLFFSDDPEKFFSGARIEVVQFADDAGGDLIEEKEFGGPIPDQVRSCLNYLRGIGGTMLEKIPDQAEVERTVPYPYGAVEEAVVNAVFHRSYEYPPEPVKVYIYPDSMEITSYPGPVPGIRAEHLKRGRLKPVPARNRRIGEFLKDLKLAEGRGTGIAKIRTKMKENGSPEPVFDFDETRTYFSVVLPVHPRYHMLQAVRTAGELRLTGKIREAVEHLKRALERQPGSGIMAKQLIEYAFETGDPAAAQEALANFESQAGKSDAAQPYLAAAKGLLDSDRTGEAEEVLKRLSKLKEFDKEDRALQKKIEDLEKRIKGEKSGRKENGRAKRLDVDHTAAAILRKLGSKYELKDKLGEGIFTKAYLVRHNILREYHVIKILDVDYILRTLDKFGVPDSREEFGEIIDRFLKKMKVFKKIYHTNIIIVYDIDLIKRVSDGIDVPFIIVQYVKGKHLNHILKNNSPLEFDRVNTISGDILNALAAIHERGIVHRDIRPANIVVQQNGQAVIIDFGITKDILKDPQISLTRGSRDIEFYMSPEQFRGVHIGQETDIYSFGVILFEMLAGEKPFKGNNPFEIINAHINEPVPDIRKINPNLPEGIMTVLEKALAKDPADRFAGAAEFRDSLLKLSTPG
ncbi:MAG: protein kinase [Candidatus Aminicenantes bacterium]|nr:protein kinase [Candidatus Aminicenantes bacterium]